MALGVKFSKTVTAGCCHFGDFRNAKKDDAVLYGFEGLVYMLVAEEHNMEDYFPHEVVLGVYIEEEDAEKALQNAKFRSELLTWEYKNPKLLIYDRPAEIKRPTRVFFRASIKNNNSIDEWSRQDASTWKEENCVNKVRLLKVNESSNSSKGDLEGTVPVSESDTTVDIDKKIAAAIEELKNEIPEWLLKSKHGHHPKFNPVNFCQDEEYEGAL